MASGVRIKPFPVRINPLPHTRPRDPVSPNFTTMGLEFFSRKVVVALALTAQLTAGFTNNGKSSMHDRFD